MTHKCAIEPDLLRWSVDEKNLSFRSTRDVDPAHGIVGQPVAIEAMRFGLECDAPGQNVYVRGVTGTGRMTLVNSLLEQLKPQARRRLDRCYVHNFKQPDRPRLVTLPAGEGIVLRKQMRELADYLESHLTEALDSPPIKSRREAIQEQTRNELEGITKPLEKELHANGLALVQLQNGPVPQAAIFPLLEGEPVAPDQYKQMAMAGKIPEAAYQEMEEKIRQYSKRMGEVSLQASQVYEKGMHELKQFMESETRKLLDHAALNIRERHDNSAVNIFLDEVLEDVIENRLQVQADTNLPDAHVHLRGIDAAKSALREYNAARTAQS